MVKRALYILPLIFCLSSCYELAFTATYHIKNGGNDALDGLTDATAWATLDQVNSVAWWGGTQIVAGDSILFKRGGKFYGMFKVTLKGTPSQPIFIGTYGSGAKPLFDGNIITGKTWTPIAGRTGYYKLAMGTGYVAFGWAYHDGVWEWLHTYPSPVSPTLRESWLDAMPSCCIGKSDDSVWIHAPYASLDSAMLLYEKNTFAMFNVLMKDLSFQNYWIGLGIDGGDTSVTVRNCEVRYTPSIAIKVFNECSHVMIDSCLTDSTCYTAIYNYIGHYCVYHANTVSNVMDSLRWGIFPTLPKMAFGGEKCGIGSQASDAASYEDGNGNRWDSNVIHDIYDSGYDAWYNIGDTIQYNTFYNIGSNKSNGTAIWLMGKDYVVRGNIVTGCNGLRCNNEGGGVNTITGNYFFSIPNGGYGIQIGSNGSGGSQVLSGNHITGLGSTTELISFEVSGNTSTNNVYNGSGEYGNLGTFYTPLSAFQSATGYESGSTYGDTPSPSSAVIMYLPIRIN